MWTILLIYFIGILISIPIIRTINNHQPADDQLDGAFILFSWANLVPVIAVGSIFIFKMIFLNNGFLNKLVGKKEK